MQLKLTRREHLLPHENSAVNAGFSDYNAEQGQPGTRTPVALAAYDETNRFVGGLDGYLFFDYLTVSRLWVAASARRQGLGTLFMDAAEKLARQAGCVGSTLSTYDFQARTFYERLGYTVFGTLPNNPRGHERFFMAKVLSD